MIENYTEEKLIKMLDDFFSKNFHDRTTPQGYIWQTLEWIEEHRLCVQDVEKAIDRMAEQNYVLKNGLIMKPGSVRSIAYVSEEYENSITSGNLQCIKKDTK